MIEIRLVFIFPVGYPSLMDESREGCSGGVSEEEFDRGASSLTRLKDEYIHLLESASALWLHLETIWIMTSITYSIPIISLLKFGADLMEGWATCCDQGCIAEMIIFSHQIWGASKKAIKEITVSHRRNLVRPTQHEWQHQLQLLRKAPTTKLWLVKFKSKIDSIKCFAFEPSMSTAALPPIFYPMAVVWISN